MADNFFPELMPRYGLHPKSGQEYWPDRDSGFPEYDKSTRYWLEAAFEEARFEHSQHEEVQNLTKYIDYIGGKQWPKRRPSYRSAPVDNRIWRLVWELVSILTDIRPAAEVKATNKEYDKHAVMLNKATRSWWMSSDADLSLALTIIYAIMTTGYGKLTWNSELRSGQGDFELMPLGPNDVFPLKARHTLDSAQAVIYKTVMPLGWFKRRYPTRAHLIDPDMRYSRFAPVADKPMDTPAMMFEMLSPAMKRIMRVQPQFSKSAYPMAVYREFWIKDWTLNTSGREVMMGDRGTNWCYKVKPGGPLYPRGRLLVMGGRAILYDGPNPYWHGRFPFADLRMNIVPWQFMGMSELSPLIPLQDIINNILAGVLDMIKKAVNPGFYAPKNAFSDSLWNSLDWSMPGAKAAYSINTPQMPQFAPAPQLPAFVMNALQMVAREMDQSSGIAAVSEAVRKKQVPSGQTLDSIKEAQQTPIRLKGRNIEIYLRNLGEMNIFNIFQFYTLKRRMFMMGSDGVTIEDFDYDPGTCIPDGESPEEHARRFAFVIHPGSLLNVNRVERSIMLMRLRMMRDISRKHLYEGIDIGIDVDEVNEELKRESQDEAATQMMMQMGGAGASALAPGGPRQQRMPKV